MDAIIALGHIAGAVLATIVLGVATMFVAGWETERNKKRFLEEASLELGVPVEDLDKDEVAPRMIRFAADRFSTELLRNRLSDLCGPVRTLWAWLGQLIQFGVLGYVVWITFSSDLGAAAYAWTIVPIAIFFGIVSAVFSFICLLFTGRYPGQAKQARKVLAEVANARHAV